MMFFQYDDRPSTQTKYCYRFEKFPSGIQTVEKCKRILPNNEVFCMLNFVVKYHVEILTIIMFICLFKLFLLGYNLLGHYEINSLLIR